MTQTSSDQSLFIQLELVDYCKSYKTAICSNAQYNYYIVRAKDMTDIRIHEYKKLTHTVGFLCATT